MSGLAKLECVFRHWLAELALQRVWGGLPSEIDAIRARLRHLDREIETESGALSAGTTGRTGEGAAR